LIASGELSEETGIMPRCLIVVPKWCPLTKMKNKLKLGSIEGITFNKIMEVNLIYRIEATKREQRLCE